MRYQFGAHKDVPNLVPQLTRLSNDAFSDYEGAMPVDDAFTTWYLKRPGCRPELCQAALWEGELVSNVLVAMQDIQLGGEVLRCGIVDTVATDAQHQRRGLARRLMDDAHRIMQDAGAEAAVLYTNPEAHPYGFYQGLGYETRAFGEAVVGPRPRRAESAEAITELARTEDEAAIRGLLDDYYGRYEGYAPMTEELWRWHRVERPPEMPCRLFVVRQGDGAVVATAAFATVDLVGPSRPAPVSVISDFACLDDERGMLTALLASAPTERIMAFVDVRASVYELLQYLGFELAVREAAMVLPFTDRAQAALARRPGPWYVMIESVVGV